MKQCRPWSRFFARFYRRSSLKKACITRCACTTKFEKFLCCFFLFRKKKRGLIVGNNALSILRSGTCCDRAFSRVVPGFLFPIAPSRSVSPGPSFYSDKRYVFESPPLDITWTRGRRRRSASAVILGARRSVWHPC